MKAIAIYGSCIINLDNHNDYSNLYNKIERKFELYKIH